jgi:hypothetical protein
MTSTYTANHDSIEDQSLLLSTAPPTNEEINDLQIKDWAESLTQIATAVRILEDALPGSNVAHIEQAFKQLHANQLSLRLFLLVRGFNV